MSRVHRPKWGQHFLKDQNVCYKIANSLSINPDDLLVEIGPGRGAMTGILALRARVLVAIEIDPELAGKLAEAFSGLPQVEILHADILDTDLSSLLARHNARSCYIFGNLPYYITSPILHHLLEAHASIRSMALLMQREVAERVTARPGSRAYGHLSVLAQISASPRITLAVPPGAFSPPPKVHSALVEFPIITRFPLWTEETRRGFLDFARICFRQKRKSLVNNLARKYSRQTVQNMLQVHGLEQNVRAEQLSPEELEEIFKSLSD
jgi:16S rRNA (adenine1518-N6/adenine1519-N6)-dimethyltransferase